MAKIASKFIAKKPSIKAATKSKANKRGWFAPKKAAPKKAVKKNPVKKLTRYAVRVENGKGQVGYFSGWDNKRGPEFDTSPAKAVKGGDRRLMEHFANAIAEKKPRGIASVEVVIMCSPEKKN
jgi:hypothetical protein